MGITTDIIYIILAALLGGLVAHALRQPLIFGYILAGIIVGPFTGGITVTHVEDIEMLAEIGVALLLFTIGLEFSIGELRRLARISFIGTPLQILLCSLAAYGLVIAVGLPSRDAVWMSAAIALSSTMVVIKTLSVRGMLESSTGRLMVAMLIAQDLAVVPMMLILPQLSQEQIDWMAIATELIKAAVLLGAMLYAGTKLVPRLFSLIAAQGSRELFFLGTLGVVFGAGALSHELGLSFALGAFLAGMLLSETDFSHQAMADISSLRDLFALIFFASVGMLFNPHFFVENIGTIITLTAGVVILKAAITSGVVRLMGYSARTSSGVGFGLSQVGEFAFVIANAGLASGGFSKDSYSLMLSVTLLSMILTPGLFWIASRTKSARRSLDVEPPHVEENKVSNLQGHVVICGGGEVGQYVAAVLSGLNRPNIVIDWNLKVVTQMRDRGLEVLFGDCSRHEMLAAAGVARASLVVLTTTTDVATPEIIREVRAMNPEVPVVVRVHQAESAEQLSTFKLDDIVYPDLEVGIELVRQSLLSLGENESQIVLVLGQLRTGRYALGPGFGERRVMDPGTVNATRFLEILWHTVEGDSELRGRTLQELQLRTRFGVSVVAAIRSEEFIATPRADFAVQEGDLLALLGSGAQLKSFRSQVREQRVAQG